jgi:hypothetical protein
VAECDEREALTSFVAGAEGRRWDVRPTTHHVDARAAHFMIDEVLVALRARLDAELHSGVSEEVSAERVVFAEGDRLDPISFKLGAITLLVVQVEEERVLRAADPFSRVRPDGARLATNPDVRLNLSLLFVARYKRYEEAWGQLSRVVGFFQRHRVLDHQNLPSLPAVVDKLTVELVTLSLSDQNEVWSALKASYQPSLLYRLKLIVFRDEDALSLAEIKSRGIEAHST